MTVMVGKRQWVISLPLNNARGWSPSWFQLILFLAGALTAGLMLLTPVYLVIRSLEGGRAAADLLLRPSTFQAMGRTLGLALAVTLASAALALPLAWLTTSTDLPGRRFWSTVGALPLVLPSYVAAYLYASILGPTGILQQTLGVEKWFPFYGFPSAFVVLTLLSYPYLMLTLQAGFRRLDPGLVDAARSLGLSPRQAFWRVTLPALRPALAAGSLLVALYVLRDFGAVAVLRYDTFTRLIYLQYQSFASRSMATTLALLLVVIAGALVYTDFRTRGRARYDRRAVGVARVISPTPLGRWRWPALALVALLVGMALALPAGGLLYWLIRGLINDQTLVALWRPAWNSLWVSLAAAGVTLLAALPVAILTVRYQGRGSQWIERLAYIGHALPGIVIALALVFFGIRFTPQFYQTAPMLIGAYVIIFAPQAIGAARTSLLQLSPRVEEAGRCLGHTPWSVLRRVTLPLLAPGLITGLALVFLTCMKELPATLILSPLGFSTLPMSVWASISEAFFARAAAPSLLLIVLSSIPLAILKMRET